MRSILEVGSEQLCQKKGYNKKSMITKIDRELAEQIVNTIKDVCDHDINFIAPSGIILASTDSSRVGTFHEIGQQVAASGSVLEVTEDNNFSGTKQGINLPLYHNELLSMSVPCFINIRIPNFLFLKYVIGNIILNLFYYYLLYITFYSKMVTVQSQAKFHKTDLKCLHF